MRNTLNFHAPVTREWTLLVVLLVYRVTCSGVSADFRQETEFEAGHPTLCQRREANLVCLEGRLCGLWW